MGEMSKIKKKENLVHPLVVMMAASSSARWL
jgi:hypothetical protein